MIVNLDTMGLDGKITAFYNNYYHDLNYAPHNDGLNELRKVGEMRVTVRNLHPDKLATARANPTNIGWVGAKPGWTTEDGKGPPCWMSYRRTAPAFLSMRLVLHRHRSAR